jgi:hypothetical protein
MPKDPEKLIQEILKIDTVLLRSRFENVGHIAALEGHRAVEDWLLRRHFCMGRDLALLSGQGVTSDAGEADVAIDVAHCMGAYTVILDEPEFVATPNSEAPAFLTATCTSTEDATLPDFLTRLDGSALQSAPAECLSNVKFKVRAWAPGGTPAGRVRFRWVCVVEVAQLTLISG